MTFKNARHFLPLLLVAILSPLSSTPAVAQTVLIEAESFPSRGGWQVDQQFMDQMGSPYLLAHGLGAPVEDAVTTVQLPKGDEYRVLVRTRDWVGPWNAPGSPGRFELKINGKALETTFGVQRAQWHWQDGGTVELSDATVELALHDLTGFDGRCDAIILTADDAFTPPNTDPAMAEFRRQSLGLPSEPEDAGEFDLVVVGGGMAGICSAVGAARLGLDVALIQNRPLLGGNNSSEVRVHLNGKINQPPYPALGNLVYELGPRRQGNARPADYYEDQKKLDVVAAQQRLHLFLNTHAFAVDMQGDHITAVIAKNIVNSRELRFRAPLFADCTGDGTIGYLAGADFRMGREGRDQTDESLAPEEPDLMTMGTSCQWYSLKEDERCAFPDCPWAVQFDETNYQRVTMGDWDWETGLNRDQITEFEFIRDYAFRVVYGNWAYLKNHSSERDDLTNRRLSWLAYVGGKRESRRLLGDVILQEQDIVQARQFPDACVTTTWTIDLHYPKPENTEQFPGEEFRTFAAHKHIKPYAIPYRCLYSRNRPNLFMAGRNISVTHVALGTVRVMRTGGMMGEVVGMAAAVCRRHDVDPHCVYEEHLDELKQLMTAGVAPSPPPPAPPVKSLPPEWLAQAGVNLAREAAVGVSGNYNLDMYPIANINDGHFDVGSNATRWVSNAEVPGEVELTWQQPQTFNAVRLVTGQSGGGTPQTPVTDFVLQYNDRSTWMDVPETNTADNQRFDWNARFAPVSASRVRLLVTRTPGDLTRIWELELYRLPAEE